MLGLALAAFGQRRRRVLIGAPVAVLAVAALACGATLQRAQRCRRDRPRPPDVLRARRRLVQLLDAAANARKAGDGYASKVQGAVGGFASLLTDPSAGRLDDTRPALLASDLHNNRVALNSLALRRAAGRSSSSALQHHRPRARVALSCARRRCPAAPFVFVSGNHDSDTLETRARARRRDRAHARRDPAPRRHATAPRRPTSTGCVVAGFDDPLEWRSPNPADPRRIFSFSELPDPEQAVEAGAAGPAALVRRPPAPPRRGARPPERARAVAGADADGPRRHAAADRSSPATTTASTSRRTARSPSSTPAPSARAASTASGATRSASATCTSPPPATSRPPTSSLSSPCRGAAQAQRVVTVPCTARGGVCQLFPAPGAGPSATPAG